LTAEAPRVVDRDVHHPIGNRERLEELLLDRQQPLVLLTPHRGRPVDEREHLDLVELVHAEDPAGVAPAAPASRRKQGEKPA
jgi:hypothetical protein